MSPSEPDKKIQLHESWLNHLESTFQSQDMQQLHDFLLQEKSRGKQLYPPGPLIFNALNSTPLDHVKVVILGQDPYHGPGQAHGLSFSVPQGIKTPPSLQNIYKEIARDMGHPIPAHGCLQSWTDQGVLLLNSVLTVEDSKAASHQKQGWEQFTDRIIQLIGEQRQHVVYMLWGRYAQDKGCFIDQDNNLVLTSTHPSPLSAYRGFLGCGHFSQANAYLKKHDIDGVDWRV